MKSSYWMFALGLSIVIPCSASANLACKPIADACMKEGYVRGGEEGHRLIKDCMEPVVNGEKMIDGLTLTEEQKESCKKMLMDKMEEEGQGRPNVQVQ